MGLCRSLGIQTPLHGPFISPDASTVFSWIRQDRADSRGPKQKSNWETTYCRSAIRFKVEAHIPHFYFSWGFSFLFLLSSSTLYSCKTVTERLSSWAISGQGRITTTNYQPGSKSVNFSVSGSWRTLMRQWWCCKGTFNNKRASRKKAVKE